MTPAPMLPSMWAGPRIPRPKICVVAAGHLSTCPRMLKAADAFDEAGYDVRVVSTRSTDWATAADGEVRRSRKWQWSVVDYGRLGDWKRYVRSGLSYHGMRRLARILAPNRLPLGLAARAYSRAHSGLLQAITAAPCDLIYAGQAGALAAAAIAHRGFGVPYALDLEDFHSAEQPEGPAQNLGHQLAARIEGEILQGASFLTCGSAAIADSYEAKYGVRALPIYNTFPLPAHAPQISVSAGAPLKLYWFSQTIGPNRGLLEVVRAMALAGIRGELHLRGRTHPAFVQELQELASEKAPLLSVVVHEPAPPDRMVALCQGYDAGLAVEPGFSHNNRVAVSNKACTYMLAGLAVVLTDTLGQRCLVDDLGADTIFYKPGDVAALAAGLKAWAHDPAKLLRAKQTAWAAAQYRWHWEHPKDRGALLAAVARAIVATRASSTATHP